MLFCPIVPPPETPGRFTIRSGPGCCLLPSPCPERLGSPKHLSADNLTRLPRSLIVAAHWFAPPPCRRAFDTPLGPVGSLLPVGVCYRALRRLPGQDFHLQEQRVLQDAPWANHSTLTKETHRRRNWDWDPKNRETGFRPSSGNFHFFAKQNGKKAVLPIDIYGRRGD